MRLCTRTGCAANSSSGSAVATPILRSDLAQRWRRQVGCRLRLGERRGPRPLALVGYQIRDSSADGFVPLDCLRFFSVFDEDTSDDRLATRLLGFRGYLTPGGIQFGGASGSLIDKDLRLPPARGGNGCRLDAAETGLVEAAFGWERHLERCARREHFPRRATLRFPDWWCAVTEPVGDLLSRVHQERTLVELGPALKRGFTFEMVFADLKHVPKRQVVACREPERLLCGSNGLTTFDLYHSRFRRTPRTFRS